MESIALARSKHDLVSSELCEKLSEISQLNECFKSEKYQSEETMKLAAILDPITSNIVFIEIVRHEVFLNNTS